MLRLNDDPEQRVVLPPQSAQWVASPLPGVTRRMLSRTGDEVARATSLVCYAANSSFAAHTHGGGEEFLVLDGVFSDEHGDYPAGWYLRNPPGTSHTPSSARGCLIFVKLWRFAADDLRPVRLDTRRGDDWVAIGPGVQRCTLHTYGALLRTTLERWAPDRTLTHEAGSGGEEILVLDGELRDAQDRYPAGTWLRQPMRDARLRASGPEGALLYRETGGSLIPQVPLPGI